MIYTASDYPFLVVVICFAIGAEPVFFCIKLLWEAVLYRLGFHPRTFRPGWYLYPFSSIVDI